MFFPFLFIFFQFGSCKLLLGSVFSFDCAGAEPPLVVVSDFCSPMPGREVLFWKLDSVTRSDVIPVFLDRLCTIKLAGASCGPFNMDGYFSCKEFTCYKKNKTEVFLNGVSFLLADVIVSLGIWEVLIPFIVTALLVFVASCIGICIFYKRSEQIESCSEKICSIFFPLVFGTIFSFMICILLMPLLGFAALSAQRWNISQMLWDGWSSSQSLAYSWFVFRWSVYANLIIWITGLAFWFRFVLAKLGRQIGFVIVLSYTAVTGVSFLALFGLTLAVSLTETICTSLTEVMTINMLPLHFGFWTDLKFFPAAVDGLFCLMWIIFPSCNLFLSKPLFLTRIGYLDEPEIGPISSETELKQLRDMNEAEDKYLEN